MSSTLIEVAEEREPLLQREEEGEDAIAPATSSPDKSNASTSPDLNRLASLDVFRGLTVALMILVDDVGGAFPSINHSPWFGVTLADFVMPLFLFSVGVSVGLVFKCVSNKVVATEKVVFRAIKLFLLGLLLQGGYFHGRGDLAYGVDVDRIRWMGVLQRIAIGYLLASLSEIWLLNNVVVDSPVNFVRRYYVQWVVVLLLCLSYTCLLYGLYVPDWTFEVPSINFAGSGQIVNCGVRGSLEPPCNAVGLIDRIILGPQHLYQRPVYRRIKECSVNSPDYGPMLPDSPMWCLAPFDPEGILSSLMAAVTCFVGLQFGHIIIHYKNQMQRVLIWSIISLPLLAVGYVLEILGIPSCKPLYTLSYMCITAGASGLLLTVIFYIVDIKRIRTPTMMLQWMGMNALIVYALAACELFPAALQGFYWHTPENNLVDGTEFMLQTMLHSKKWGTLTFVILEIIYWGFVAGFLHRKDVLRGKRFPEIVINAIKRQCKSDKNKAHLAMDSSRQLDKQKAQLLEQWKGTSDLKTLLTGKKRINSATSSLYLFRPYTTLLSLYPTYSALCPNCLGPKHCVCTVLYSMATDDVNTAMTDSNGNDESIQQENSTGPVSTTSNREQSFKPRVGFEKALAHRAIYALNVRRTRSRKAVSPSRLSRVTLADDGSDPQDR